MFIYRRLPSGFKSISVNCIYIAQWDKQDWVVSLYVIYIERSLPHFQILMDRIIDILWKGKNRESFVWSVHVLIILLYIGLRRLVQ